MDRATFIRLATEKYGDEFDYSYIPGLLKKRSPETIICRRHGKLRVSPREHLRSKYGCPRCRCEKVRVPVDRRISGMIDKAKDKFNNKFDYSKVDSVSKFSDQVTIVCPKHGSFRTTIKSHLHSLYGCAMCGNEHAVENKTKYRDLVSIIPHVRAIHGDRYEYLAYDIQTKIIRFSCKHGINEQELRTHLSGRGCKACGYDRMRMSSQDFLRRAKLVHPEGYEYNLDEFATVNDKITIRHSCGHQYRGRVSNHLSGQGCIRCKSSVGENKVAEWLTDKRIRVVHQFKIEGYRYRYDFYLPDLNILIEYDGEQHYRPIDYFGGQVGFQRNQTNDQIKNELAKAYGYSLIRIPFNQLANLEIFLSRAIDWYFNYCVDGVFYKTFMHLARARSLPDKMPVSHMDEYRTFKVLSPLS